MTTSPEALREAVERLTAHAEFIGQPDAGVVMVAFPRHVVAADLTSVLAELSRLQEENRQLRSVDVAARAVVLAAKQDDMGEWTIGGDAELMLGDLYLATEAVRGGRAN